MKRIAVRILSALLAAGEAMEKVGEAVDKAGEQMQKKE